MAKQISICLSFDFDAISVWVGPRGTKAAPLIARGEFDLAAVVRALIASPEWPNLVRAGRLDELQAYQRSQLAELV